MSLILTITALIACTPPDIAKSGTAGDADDTALDSGGDGPEFPCANGSWADYPADGGWLHVRAAGNDDENGSAEDPFATLGAALRAGRESGKKTIFLGPGEFSVTEGIAHDIDGGSDDGLRILGCGSDETTLASPSDDDSILKLSAASGIALEGFQLTGGRRPLFIWQGSTATLADIIIHDASATGMLVDGAATAVTATGVAIENIHASDGDDGYGIVVNLGLLTLDNVAIAHTTRAGIMLNQASMSASNLSVIDTIAGTEDVDGYGIYADASPLRIDGAVLQRNRVAAIRVIDGVDTALTNVTISATAGNDDGLYGDGIALSQSGNFDPAYFVHTVTGCRVEQSARTGILADGVTISALTGNAVSENAYSVEGVSIIAQHGAVMPESGDPWKEATTTLDLP